MESASRPARGLRRLLSELVFAVGLAASVWLLLHLGLRAVGQALSTIGIGGILFLVLAHLPTLTVLGLCWWLLAGEAGGWQPAKFVWGRLLRDAGGDLLPFTPLGGYVLGVRAVVLTGLSGVEAAVSGLLDLFVEQAAKTAYAIAGVLLLLLLAPRSALAVPALVLLGFSIGLIAAVSVRWGWVRDRLLKLAARFDQLWPDIGARDRRTAKAALAAALARRGRIGLGFGLHLLGWCLGAAEVWLALYLLGAPVSFGEAVAIDGVFAAVRGLAFAVPSAIGVQEATYVALCGVFGVDGPTALAFSLVRRARDLVVGGPAVLIWQFLERKRRSSRPALP
jgi:putative membrane protein